MSPADRELLAAYGPGDRAMQSTDGYALVGRSAEDLDAAGVHPGTRVCVHRSRRSLVGFGDFVGCWPSAASRAWTRGRRSGSPPTPR